MADDDLRLAVAELDHDDAVAAVLRTAIARVERYQAKIRFAQNTFAGLSPGASWCCWRWGCRSSSD